VACLTTMGWILWLLGYPDEALKRNEKALILTQGLSHPLSRAHALIGSDTLHNFRREGQVAQEWAEEAIARSTEHGLAFFLTAGFIHHGWALAQQGRTEEGLAQIHKGLTASRATGTEAYRASYLGILAGAHRAAGQPEEGLTVVTEALTVVDKTGERWWEAELYRLKGELTLQSQVGLGQVEDRSQASQDRSEAAHPQPLAPDPQGEAEACFLKAIEIARKQQAKSWELRASTSLARLWQQQGKCHEAHTLLAEVYDWFTEGFDTKDLQEAKTLLEALA
jgi:predicted ATPase